MVKMWVLVIITALALVLLPSAHAGIGYGSTTAEYPTDSITYWAVNGESSAYNYTTFIANSVPGVWTDPTTIELNETYDMNWGHCPSNSCKSFEAKFNWSEIPLGIHTGDINHGPYVCLEHCSGMSCVDECAKLTIFSKPRINLNMSAEDQNILQETNFTITLANPTAGNIIANTTAKIMLNGNEVRTFDFGSTDMAPHSTQNLVQNWTPDKAGPYKVDANIIFYSADYNNSEQFSNSSEIDVNEGSPTTSQIINIEDLPDTSSKDFTITVTNPTGFDFTTNLTAKAIYGANTNWSDTQSVQLDPLSEKNVTFTWKPDFRGPFDIKSEDDYNSTSTTINVGKPDVDLSFTIEYGLIHDGLEGFFVNAYVENPTGFKFTATNADFQLYLDDNGSRTGVSNNDFGDLSIGAFETKSEYVVIPYHEYSDRADVDVGQSTSGSVGSQGNSMIVSAKLNPKGALKADLKAYGKTLTKDIGSDPYVLMANGIAVPNNTLKLPGREDAVSPAPKQESKPGSGMPLPDAGNLQVVNAGNLQITDTQTTVVLNNTVTVRINALQPQNSFVSR